MQPIDYFSISLLFTSVCLGAVELGLAAYTVQHGTVRAYSTYIANWENTGYGSYEYGWTIGDAPAQVKWLLFCACWTVFFSSLLIIVPMTLGPRIRLKARGGLTSEQAYGFASLCVNSLTMVFWVCGFGVLAHLYVGYGGVEKVGGVVTALLAIAVVIWVIQLVLLVIDFVTTIGHVRSDRLGHFHIEKRKRRRAGKSVSWSSTPTITPRSGLSPTTTVDRQQAKEQDLEQDLQQ